VISFRCDLVKYARASLNKITACFVKCAMQTFTTIMYNQHKMLNNINSLGQLCYRKQLIQFA